MGNSTHTVFHIWKFIMDYCHENFPIHMLYTLWKFLMGIGIFSWQKSIIKFQLEISHGWNFLMSQVSDQLLQSALVASPDKQQGFFLQAHNQMYKMVVKVNQLQSSSDTVQDQQKSMKTQH